MAQNTETNNNEESLSSQIEKEYKTTEDQSDTGRVPLSKQILEAIKRT